MQTTVDTTEARGPMATLAAAAVIILAGFAFLGWGAMNVFVVYPLLDPAHACKRSHDLGIGLTEVVDADRTWLPPGVDCVIEDRELPSSPRTQTRTQSRHHFPSEGLASAVAATDVLAVVAVCAAVGWTRRSRNRHT